MALNVGCSSAIPVFSTHIPPESRTAQFTYSIEIGGADFDVFDGAMSSPEWCIPVCGGVQINYGLSNLFSTSSLIYYSGFEIGMAGTIRIHHHFSMLYLNIGMNGGLSYGGAYDYEGLASILTPEICIGFGRHVFAGYRYSPKRAKSISEETIEEDGLPAITNEKVTRYNVTHHNLFLGGRFEKQNQIIIPHILYIIDSRQKFHQLMVGISISRELHFGMHRKNDKSIDRKKP